MVYCYTTVSVFITSSFYASTSTYVRQTVLKHFEPFFLPDLRNAANLTVLMHPSGRKKDIQFRKKNISFHDISTSLIVDIFLMNESDSKFTSHASLAHRVLDFLLAPALRLRRKREHRGIFVNSRMTERVEDKDTEDLKR